MDEEIGVPNIYKKQSFFGSKVPFESVIISLRNIQNSGKELTGHFTIVEHGIIFEIRIKA